MAAQPPAASPPEAAMSRRKTRKTAPWIHFISGGCAASVYYKNIFTESMNIKLAFIINSPSYVDLLHGLKLAACSCKSSLVNIFLSLSLLFSCNINNNNVLVLLSRFHLICIPPLVVTRQFFSQNNHFL
jgi:hypothetical protein